MKKLFLSLVFSLVAGLFVSAQVTYPTKDTVWYPGDKVTITWNTNNNLGGSLIRITLDSSRNGILPPLHKWLHISYYEVGNNQGKFEWIVPDDPTTEERSFRIVIAGNEPYEYLISDVFHVRFGKKRPTETKLRIQQAVYLSWPATYGTTYEIEGSDDLTTWTSFGTVVADDEELDVTVLADEGSKYFRLREDSP